MYMYINAKFIEWCFENDVLILVHFSYGRSM